MTPLIVIGILIVGAIFILAGMYNSLVQLRVRADSAWSDIDIQLKRRHDLIPNLVETVKGYAAHEKGTFENIAKFRSQAMQATTPGDKAAAETQLSGALKSLFAVAENYPELKASEQFTSLQSSLNSVKTISRTLAVTTTRLCVTTTPACNHSPRISWPGCSASARD